MNLFSMPVPVPTNKHCVAGGGGGASTMALEIIAHFCGGHDADEALDGEETHWALVSAAIIIKAA